MGQYDNLAALKYISEMTGQKSSYVAHSQGTTSMFYGLGMFEDDIAAHINLFVGLNPVTKLPNTGKYLKVLGDNYEKVTLFTKKIGLHAVGVNMDLAEKIAFYEACDINEADCRNLLEVAMSSDPEFDDVDRFNIAMANNGGKTPWKSMLHYAQTM